MTVSAFSSIPTKVDFGTGAIQRVPGILAPLAGRVFLVSTAGLMETLGLQELLVRRLCRHHIAVEVFDDIHANPEEADIETGAQQLSYSRADLILAVGGGSALDAAKLIGMRATNPGPVARYCGTGRLERAPMPVIAVPTTAGSGSEVTPYAVVSRHAEGKSCKQVIRDHRLFPLQAILDPLLTLPCPDRLLASAGIDALSHALESYLSPRSSPASAAIAIQALRELGQHLPRARENRANLHHREHLMHASLLAGTCIALTGATLLHAMTYPVTCELGLPHGQVLGLLLPSFWKQSYPCSGPGLQQLYQALIGHAPKSLERQLHFLQAFLVCVGLEPPPRCCVTGMQARRWTAQVMQNPGKLRTTPGFSGAADVLTVYEDAFSTQCNRAHLARCSPAGLAPKK